MDFFETALWAVMWDNKWVLFWGLMALLFILVGIANHSLPSREGIQTSKHIGGKNSQATPLAQYLAQFSASTSSQDTSIQPTNTQTTNSNVSSVYDYEHATDPDIGNLSGIYPIASGRNALTVRVLLTKLAQTSLDLQYYMWHDDASGRLLFHEIWKAAERGVRVRLLIDDNNTSGMDAVMQTLDSHPNIELRLFNPFMNRTFRMIGYITALKRLNHRMHNKSFTVDNHATIVGGRNIGDEYFDIDAGMNFADLDVLAVGSIVTKVSDDFDRYWNCDLSYPLSMIVTKQHAKVDLTQAGADSDDERLLTYQECISNSDFMQQLSNATLSFEWAPVNLISDAPEKALDRTEKKLLDDISALMDQTRQALTIVSPYFIPAKAGTQQLSRLAKNGIDIHILTNSLTANDVLAVHSGYIRYRLPLLKQGIKMFELKPSKRATHRTRDPYLTSSSSSSLHAKTFSIDAKRLFIGSFNFDPRSAGINTEMGVVIESANLARQLEDTIEDWTSELSYVVELNNEQIQWLDHGVDPTGTFRCEPESSWHQRLLVKAMYYLPIEHFL